MFKDVGESRESFLRSTGSAYVGPSTGLHVHAVHVRGAAPSGAQPGSQHPGLRGLCDGQGAQRDRRAQ